MVSACSARAMSGKREGWTVGRAPGCSAILRASARPARAPSRDRLSEESHTDGFHRLGAQSLIRSSLGKYDLGLSTVADLKMWES